MLSKAQVYQIIDFVINEAKGYDTQVLVQASEEGLTRFANSEIHQNMYEDVTKVVVQIQSGKKRSEITTTLYTEEGLRAAVADAIANLDFLPEGEMEIPLVDAPALMESYEVNEELARAYNIQERAKIVKRGIELLDPQYLAYGALSQANGMFAFGNSRGIKRFAYINYVEFSVLISHESGGSGYAEQFSDRPEELDIVKAFQTAYDKAKMNQNPLEVQPGAYTVILEPLAVSEILMYLCFSGFSGKSVQDRYSFLTGKLGEKIFDEKITIVDDCTDPHTLRMAFDFEGMPKQIVPVIEKGVARAVVYDMMSAMKDGVPSTGHSVGYPGQGGIPLNLVMAEGTQSLEELIRSTENGLLITRFNYMNIVIPRQASLTALTRDGVFKIENGKLAGAVKNMRFTESMLEALKTVAGISQERQRCKAMFGNFYVPSLKLDNFHFTGKTDA